MQKRSLFLAVALAAALAPTALNAQSPNPLADRFTVAAAFGGHSGAADVNPTGAASWKLGWAGSIDANYWIQPKIGVRVGGTWAQDSLAKFAGNFGAGIEYRFSRIGVRAEARDYVYKFDRYGYDKTQHDVAWQGGVTLSF